MEKTMMTLNDAQIKLSNALNSSTGNRFYKIHNVIDRVAMGARYSDCKREDCIDEKLSDELIKEVLKYTQ